LLEEELAKIRPLLSSFETFRAAAYGDDGAEGEKTADKYLATEIVPTLAGDAPTTDTKICTCATSNPTIATTNVLRVAAKGDTRESETPTREQCKAEILVSDEAAMSVGDSKEEEDESDGFSRSGSSSSLCESIPSCGSRKRPAHESPERELCETSHKGFPGVVSRSEA